MDDRATKLSADFFKWPKLLSDFNLDSKFYSKVRVRRKIIGWETR